MQLQLWKRVVFYGLILWVVVFLMIALLVLLGLNNRSIPTDTVLLIIMFLGYWTLATRLHLVSLSQGFLVGLVWLTTNLLLDYFVIVKGFNSGSLAFYYAWIIWARYLLLVLIPILISSRRQVGL